jgi:hypothetical protein
MGAAGNGKLLHSPRNRFGSCQNTNAPSRGTRKRRHRLLQKQYPLSPSPSFWSEGLLACETRLVLGTEEYELDSGWKEIVDVCLGRELLSCTLRQCCKVQSKKLGGARSWPYICSPRVSPRPLCVTPDWAGILRLI